MDETPPYQLDVDGLCDDESGSGEPGDRNVGRPWIGILFACCEVYTRIYRNREQTGYTGNCPKCGRRVSLRIGSNGVSSRFFTAE